MVPRINWKPSRRDLFKFGVTILVGFGIIGGILILAGKPTVGLAMWAVSGAVCVLAIVAPPAAKPLYWLWMGVALVMGTIMGRLVMTLIFFLVLTPVAAMLRWRGRDALALKKPSAATYWTDLPEIDRDSYDHLF